MKTTLAIISLISSALFTSNASNLTKNNLQKSNNTVFIDIGPGKNSKAQNGNAIKLTILDRKTKYQTTRSLYLNSTKDYINIKTRPNTNIQIFDQQNNLIEKFNNDFGESFVDIRDLEKGSYRVDITEPGSDVTSYQLQID